MLLLLASLTLLVGVACSEDSEPVDGSGETEGTEAGGKEDCIGCDPEGPSAFEQLGLGDGFWQVGDSWQVVYLLKTDSRVQMQPMEFGQQERPDAGMTVLSFEVTEIYSVEVEGVLRPAATIVITQTQAAGQLRQHVEAVEIQADANVEQISLVIDDLFRPISITEFDANHPNGLYIQADTDAIARSAGNGFPYVVPNVSVDHATAPLPILPPELHVVAADMRQGYDTQDYAYFDIGGFGSFASESVYWAQGDLWPFYVETEFAAGILVSQSR